MEVRSEHNGHRTQAQHRGAPETGSTCPVSRRKRRQSDWQQAEEERSRLMETLATEHARLEAILCHLPSGVLVAEAPTGTVVLSNRQVEQILGHPVRLLQNIDAYREWVGWHLDGRPVQP